MMRRDIPTLCIDALAAYRLTRLITKDVILDDVRNGIVGRAYMRQLEHRRQSGMNMPVPPVGLTLAEYAAHDADAPKLATLVICYWCSGFYVSIAVIAARRWAPGLWDPIARVLATSAVAALTAGLER